MSCHSGWVGPTALLCIYGFCSMMRPIEPFFTKFLTTYKNLTTEQVNRQVYPVWTYSTLVLLVPVLLLTDLVRYKPVVVLQGLSYVVAFLMVILGSGVRWAQLAFFIYSVAMAADVAYFSYIYGAVQPCHYQRVTGYVRGSILVGYSAGALLAQLLVSLTDVSLYCLAIVTLTSTSVALVTSLLLPMPRASLFMKETHCGRQGETDDASDNRQASTWKRSASYLGRAFNRLVSDWRECFSSVALVFFCVWGATARCGYYQVAGYTQVFWINIQPQNFTAYNGAVDSISTLTGAAATFAVGHVTLDWSVWGELVLGGFTLVIAGALFLMDLMDNIWASYSCIVIFKTVYMPLATICTFQIAKMLTRERYALVFGAMCFVSTVLQSVLTAVVINTKTLHLTITSQFLVYASFFAVISLLFVVRGVYTAVHKYRPTHDQDQDQDQCTRV